MGLKLGQFVKYLRLDEQNNPIEGEGFIHMLLIGLENRVQARVHDVDGVSKFNIDLPAINASEQSKALYIDHVSKIRVKAAEFNEAIKALAAQGNIEIEAMNAEYFGPPLDLTVPIEELE